MIFKPPCLSRTKETDVWLELLEDIQDGESQIDAGKGIPHEKALKKVLKRVAK